MDTASDWFARQMSDVRTRHGRRHRSQRALAMRLDALGIDISQKALERLEAGRRARGVTLDEALQLAYALHVAPVHLMTPRDDDAMVQITPGTPHTPAITAPAREVRAWIRGERPLPGVDEIAYRQEVPESERAQHVRTSTTVVRELADAIDRAGDPHERRELAGLLVAVVRRLFHPLDVEWPGETEIMRAAHPDLEWRRPDDESEQ